VSARVRSGTILAASVVAILSACAWEAWLMRLQYGDLGSLDGLFVRSLVLALGSVVGVALPCGMLVGLRSAHHTEIGYGQLALEFATLTMLVAAVACWVRADWPAVVPLVGPPTRIHWVLFAPILAALGLVPALRHLVLRDRDLSVDVVLRDVLLSLVATIGIVSIALGDAWSAIDALR
jgi:hypothetical protein